MPLAVVSVTGSLAGVVGFLILVACAEERPGIGSLVGQALAAVYYGYFGAALGVAVLALLGVFFDDAPHRPNALKALLQLVIGGASTIGFALLTPVAWDVAGARPEGERSRAARGPASVAAAPQPVMVPTHSTQFSSSRAI